MPEDEKPIVIGTDQARQGVTGQNVRYVLFWGTGIAVVVMVILYFTLLHSHAPTT